MSALQNNQIQTIEDWENLPEGTLSYFSSSQIFNMSPTSWEHGAVQAKLTNWVINATEKTKSRIPKDFDEWLFITEASVRYEQGPSGFIHDIAGWKKSRWVPPNKKKHVISITSDWVCEILSPTNSSKDCVDVRDILLLSKVPYYWIIDINRKAIIVYSYENQYKIAKIFNEKLSPKVKIEPFDEVISIEELFSSLI